MELKFDSSRERGVCPTLWLNLRLESADDLGLNSTSYKWHLTFLKKKNASRLYCKKIYYNTVAVKPESFSVWAGGRYYAHVISSLYLACRSRSVAVYSGAASLSNARLIREMKLKLDVKMFTRVISLQLTFVNIFAYAHFLNSRLCVIYCNVIWLVLFNAMQFFSLFLILNLIITPMLFKLHST